jgi:hypothetical protein
VRLATPGSPAPNPKVRDPAEAVRLAAHAAELTAHKDPVVLDVLAAAYAAAGEWDRATSTAETAMALGLGPCSRPGRGHRGSG